MAPWSPIRRDRETPAPESCRADAYRRLVFIEGAAHRQGPVRGRTLAGRGSLLDGSFRFLAQVHPPSRHRTRAEGGNADDQGTIREIIIGAIPLEELNEKVESLLEAAA